MIERIVTRIPLHNGPRDGYPQFLCVWTRAENRNWLAFDAKASVWRDGSTEQERKWTASMTLTVPATSLCMMVEEVKGGCWRLFPDMPPVFDVSTFWWATRLMVESLKTHPDWKL